MEDLLDPQTVREVLALIERYGYLFVLFSTLLQSIGLPIPAQTILFTAGVMAGQEILDPMYAAAFGLAGALLGSQIGYSAGSRGGRPFVLRWGHYVRITPERLNYAEKLFKGHARRTVLVARFVPVLKTFGYLTAGISRMPRTTFFRYDFLGTAAWVTVSVLTGYFVSEGVESFIE